MSDVKKKLSLLKVERRIKNLKGIKDVHFLTDKPKEIAWYAGELNPIDSPIPCLYEFSANLTTKDLSRSIQSLVGNSSRFILVFWEFSPVTSCSNESWMTFCPLILLIFYQRHDAFLSRPGKSIGSPFSGG